MVRAVFDSPFSYENIFMFSIGWCSSVHQNRMVHKADKQESTGPFRTIFNSNYIMSSSEMNWSEFQI
ncbi:hypothetical protein JTE90_027435 [Oedothorax gibbosus]|uniref:Uncharacterized protein n=1 Tax=Oedothorax gibbosus TaxID=931172 RepID=A0AAV6W357_9ARAC|nr:hypothetical protein JTE90_027435 [Oedothorax gibbosus]